MLTPLMAAKAAWQQALCAIWPHDAGVSGTVRSTAPIVFLNGTADPTDPPANVAAAPRTTPNGLLVSIPGGHEGAATGCLLTETTAFIQPVVPATRQAGQHALAPCSVNSRHSHPPLTSVRRESRKAGSR